MKFREGLLQIYKNRQTDGEITDPFYLYCRLSDLCSSTYEDKKKVELFYAIDKRLCVFETLIKQGKNGEKELLNSYIIVSELLSEESFKKLIECAVWVMSSMAQPPVATTKKEEKASPPKLQKIIPVKVEKAEESKTEETRTLLQSSSNLGVADDVDFFIGAGAIMLLATIIAGLLLWICGWGGSWTAWQWVIGIVGGGWLALAAAFFIYIWNDAFVADYYVSGIISVIAFALINFIFLLIFRDDYKVIFGSFAVWNIIGSVILSAICFDDVEDEWGWVFVVAVIILLIGMIVSLIWL